MLDCGCFPGRIVLSETILGSVFIWNNAPGCNSLAEVTAAYDAATCGAVAAEDGPSTGAAPLVAYPNPAAGPATLAFAVAQPTEATVVVYDALGREVARPVDGLASGAVSATLPALPAGLYVARLTTADGREESVRLTVLR